MTERDSMGLSVVENNHKSQERILEYYFFSVEEGLQNRSLTMSKSPNDLNGLCTNTLRR